MNTYTDYNNDKIPNAADNFMSYWECDVSSKKFTPLQKMAINDGFDQYWNGVLTSTPTNLKDRVEFKGTSNRMKNVVIQWRHPTLTSSLYSNSISNYAGAIQTVLYSPTVTAKTFKLGSAIGTSSFQFGGNPLPYPAPVYNYNDWIKDIDVHDLSLIGQNVLGIRVFTNGYDKIAADVNKDGVFSKFDYYSLQFLILGEYQALPAYDAPWVFVPEYIPFEYTSQFNSNPFNMTINGQLVTGITYTTDSWQFDINNGFNEHSGFDGIKIGDVDSPAYFVANNDEEYLTCGQDAMSVTNNLSELIVPSHVYDINIKATGINQVSAFQAGLFVNHNVFNVVDGKFNNVPESPDFSKVYTGALSDDRISMLWTKGDGTTFNLSDNTTIFHLKAVALQPLDDINNAINFNDPITKTVFYNSEGCKIPVTLSIEVSESEDRSNNDLYAFNEGRNSKLFCFPNPTKNQFSIYFDNDIEEVGEIVLTNPQGALISKTKVNLLKGANKYDLSLESQDNIHDGFINVALITNKSIRHANLIKI